MATTVVPMRTDGAQRYSMRLQLAGTVFAFVFIWNARDSSWSMQISDASGNLLISKKITVGTPMTWRYATATLPKGEFLALDTSGADQDPGLTDLGSRVLLTFTDAADLP
jgi:hypothetical protein